MKHENGKEIDFFDVRCSCLPDLCFVYKFMMTLFFFCNIFSSIYGLKKTTSQKKKFLSILKRKKKKDKKKFKFSSRQAFYDM